ncbi:MAG TPA: response regulator [Candidatus Paceibacterota bacterium]
MKILIIEDEEILARTMSEKLVREGFDVLVALDGLQGLQMALSEHPDIILLDIILPKLDGLSMLRKLREDSWGSHVKVIILSNLSDSRGMTKGVDIGLNDVSLYLVKTDWSLDDMVVKIKERLV